MPIGIKRAYSLAEDVKRKRSQKSVVSAPGSPALNLNQYLLGQGERVLAQHLTYEQMHNMYILNTWIRSCVDKILRRVVAVEPVAKAIVPFGKREASLDSMRRADEVQSFLENPNSYFENLSTIRSKYGRDLLIYDAAALEIVRDDSGKIYQLCSVSGPTVKYNLGKNGIVSDENRAFYQEIDGKKVAEFKYNEMIYSMMYPRSGYTYGLSPLETLKNTVAAELYASQYNMDFFANDATPKFAILFNQVGTQDEDVRGKMARWRDYFEQELRGNPHRPILVANEAGSVDFRMFSLKQEEMQFQEYSVWLLTKIMAVYGMQPFVMGVILPTTGRLNSEQQDEAFKEDAVKPQLRAFAEGINEYIIWDADGFGYDDVYLDYYGLDLVDNKLQSEIDETYLELGVITINDVRDELAMPRVPWGDVPLVSTSRTSLEALVGGKSDEDTEGVDSVGGPEEQEEEQEDLEMEEDFKIPEDLSPMQVRMLRRRGKNKKVPSGLTPEQEKEAIGRIIKRAASRRRKYVFFGDVGSTPVR